VSAELCCSPAARQPAFAEREFEPAGCHTDFLAVLVGPAQPAVLPPVLHSAERRRLLQPKSKGPSTSGTITVMQKDSCKYCLISSGYHPSHNFKNNDSGKQIVGITFERFYDRLKPLIKIHQRSTICGAAPLCFTWLCLSATAPTLWSSLVLMG